MIPGGINPMLLSGSGGYQIQRSLRLRASAGAYVAKSYVAGTNPADTNTRRKTYSMWAKRGSLGSLQELLCNYFDNSNFWGLFFDSSDRLNFYAISGAAVTCNKVTSQVFRDPSAEYHFMLVTDSANATAEDRAILYVNGVRVTSWSTNTTPTLNDIVAGAFLAPASGTWFAAFGRLSNATNYFDGYLSEINCIDGQALTPSSFGQYDSAGNWQAKPYAGSYGTNGFRLKFDDPTSLTTLCADSSGNGNNWTATNVSLTAGASYDSMLDVPLGGGGGERGNYATLNPLNQAGVATPVNGNLYVSQASDGAQVASTFGIASGKWYYEHTMTAVGGGENSAGIGSAPQSGGYVGGFSGQYGYYSSGAKISNGGSVSAYGASYTDGDTIGVAYDADTGSLTFYKNGVSQGVAFTGIVGTMFALAATRLAGGQNASTLNFGQRPFTYTPPSGFKPLHTGNLPDPVIAQPNKHFDSLTRIGTGATYTRTGVQFAPDLVWIKNRSVARDHALYDTVRGATKYLSSNLTTAESIQATELTAFTSDGYTLGIGLNANSAEAYVDWLWKAGGAPVTNNNGSISAQVSANPTAGFSIVTYTGTGANATVGHGLGVAPKMVITRNRGAAGPGWGVWHSGLTSGAYYLELNATAAQAVAANMWNSTVPTSSVVSLGTNTDTNSASTFVMYCFAEIPGFSKFGSYTGNGSADGPFVHCGFRPRWILFKRTTSTGGNWGLIDAARSPYNQSQDYLLPNLSSAEANGTTVSLDFTANGFKVRGTDVGVNGSGDTIIFAAFAEAPFKTALAR